VFLGIPKVIRELYENPELGFFSQKLRFKTGESFEKLESYTKHKSLSDLPTWRRLISEQVAVDMWGFGMKLISAQRKTTSVLIATCHDLI
jgi:hypothetical protein